MWNLKQVETWNQFVTEWTTLYYREAHELQHKKEFFLKFVEKQVPLALPEAQALANFLQAPTTACSHVKGFKICELYAIAPRAMRVM